MVFGIKDTVLQGDHGRQAAEETGNSAQRQAIPQTTPAAPKDRPDS